MWHDDCLYRTGPKLIIRRCVWEDEMHGILRAFHNEPCGGNFVDKRTAYKLLQLGYYWPTIFKDAEKYVASFDDCQRMGKKISVDEMPLQTRVLIEPFEKCALYYLGPISPMYKKKRYILFCTNYVTKWVETKSVYYANELVLDFLFEDIITHFGVPREIVTN